MTAKQEIGLEYAVLGQEGHNPSGCYVMPSNNDIHLWHGVLFVHRGPYAGSILRFLLTFPPAFPAPSPPSIHFTSHLWHPLVDPATGRLDTRGSRFQRWKGRGAKEGQSHVSAYLHWVKGLFKEQGLKEITESQAANKEAWRVFHENPSLFSTLAAQSSSLSSAPSTLYPSSTQAALSRRNTHQRTPSLSLRAEEAQEGEELIRFERMEEEEVREIKRRMEGSLGIGTSDAGSTSTS